MKKLLSFIFIILGCVCLDQVAKGFLIYLITNDTPLWGPAWSVVPAPYLMTRVTNFFNIVFTWNPGTSFSFLRDIGNMYPIIIIIITAVIIGWLIRYYFTSSNRHEYIALSLIIGGALGNLTDRVRFGAVIDFLDFHIGTWHYPAFNIADICIVIGVGLYLIQLIFKRGEHKNKGK